MLIELSILIVLSLLALTFLFALKYYGLFEDIEVSAGSPPFAFGHRYVAYKKAKGRYSDASALFTEVCSLVPHLNTFGIYYDDPDNPDINADKCRYIVGALLNENTPQSESDKQLLYNKGFLDGQLPHVDHVVYSSFPFKGIISVVIAIRRVYPVIKSYINEHNLCAHPGIEIYSANQIHFMFPLAKQDQFYHLYGEDDAEDSDDGSVDELEQLTQTQSTEAKTEYNEESNGDSKGSKRSSTSSSFEELHAD